MRTLSGKANSSGEEFDVDLIDHARSALHRMHESIAQQRKEEKRRKIKAQAKALTEDKNTPDKSPSKGNQGKGAGEQGIQKKTIQYISIKEPPRRTVFYEHSKRGLKYWYEDKQSKPFHSKSIMGRTGTLLGLVDSPYK